MIQTKQNNKLNLTSLNTSWAPRKRIKDHLIYTNTVTNHHLRKSTSAHTTCTRRTLQNWDTHSLSLRRQLWPRRWVRHSPRPLQMQVCRFRPSWLQRLLAPPLVKWRRPAMTKTADPWGSKQIWMQLKRKLNLIKLAHFRMAQTKEPPSDKIHFWAPVFTRGQ